MTGRSERIKTSEVKSGANMNLRFYFVVCLIWAAIYFAKSNKLGGWHKEINKLGKELVLLKTNFRQIISYKEGLVILNRNLGKMITGIHTNIKTVNQRVHFFNGLNKGITTLNKMMQKLLKPELPQCKLIAHYPFDKDFRDTKSGYNGKRHGGVKIVKHGGRFKGAAIFDGTGKVLVDAFRKFNWGSAFSVSVWFKRTGGFGNYQGIVNTGYGTRGNWEIRMGRESTGEMLGGGVGTKDNPRMWNYVYLRATKNKWHHVVMTYNGSTLTFYLNNVKQRGKYNCCHGNMIVKNTPLTIGQAGVGATREYFVGMIDSLRLYSQVLTAREIDLLYKLDKACM